MPIDFSKYQKKAILEPEPAKEKEPKIVLPAAKKIEVKKSVPKTATIQKIKEVLDDIEISQDDLWFFVRYLTRKDISTIRLSKKVLEPIFRDFINKKLKGDDR